MELPAVSSLSEVQRGHEGCLNLKIMNSGDLKEVSSSKIMPDDLGQMSILG